MVKNACKPIYPYSEWEIVEERFQAQHNLRNETMFSTGNGYIGMRGTFEEGVPGPKELGVEGTYINGFYESEIIQYGEIAYGYAQNSQTMLNVANSKTIYVTVEGEMFRMDQGTVLSYRRALSMREGILTRSLVWRSPQGREVKIEIQRLVSLVDKHIAAIRYTVTPLNFSGTLNLVSLLDTDVTNLIVKDDPRIGSGLQGRALGIAENRNMDDGGVILQQTRHSGLSLACAICHEITGGNDSVPVRGEWSVGSEYNVQVVAGEAIALTKYIAYISSLDSAVKQLSHEAERLALEARDKGFDRIKGEQADYLRDFWMRTDVCIQGDPAIQQGIRVNIFHILQSAGRDGVTNIGAKGLTGEGYEGHYFWDTETYILPFFLYNNPHISRKLLEYRYGILDQARERARQMSHAKGALFPWRTINGEECSAYYPAGTAQYHINADIAFAIKRYMDATEDEAFLLDFGAEILFETARLWSDLGHFDPRRGNHFCINGVTGPDEYNAIVDNNCYTNLMAKENMLYAYDTARWMREHAPDRYQALASSIGLDEGEPEEWKQAGERMWIPYDAQEGIYLQDDGFLDREPWDFENTPPEQYPLLLHYHPLVIYRHQVSKQADLVLALFLLGSAFNMREKKNNYDFYERVTTHDSSLSTAIFSIMASEVGYRDKAYAYFSRTARMDLDDCHGNTKDGIHVANMAGTWMCVIHGFAGMRAEDGVLRFAPYLPEGWDTYSFRITYRGSLIQVQVDRQGTEYTLLEGDGIAVVHHGRFVSLSQQNEERRLGDDEFLSSAAG